MIEKAIIEILLSNTAFANLVGNRVEPNIIKQTTTYPAVYVSGYRMEKLKCTANQGIREGTIEIGVYSDTYGNMTSIIEAIRASLDDFNGTVSGVGINIMRGIDTGDKYDDQEKKHVRIIEYDAFAQVH